MTSRWVHKYVVYRVDHFHGHEGRGNPARIVTIKEVLDTEAEAIAEVERLQALRSKARVEYRFQVGRYAVDGAGSSRRDRGEGKASRWVHQFVVYRVAPYPSLEGRARAAAELVTIEQVVDSESEALAEWEKLQALSSGEGVEFGWQSAKYYPDGR